MPITYRITFSPSITTEQRAEVSAFITEKGGTTLAVGRESHFGNLQKRIRPFELDARYPDGTNVDVEGLRKMPAVVNVVEEKKWECVVM